MTILSTSPETSCSYILHYDVVFGIHQMHGDEGRCHGYSPILAQSSKDRQIGSKVIAQGNPCFVQSAMYAYEHRARLAEREEIEAWSYRQADSGT